MQITKLRTDARQARGAEADSSVGMHQLEARLAVAAIEHKQDVRRLTETIEVCAPALGAVFTEFTELSQCTL